MSVLLLLRRSAAAAASGGGSRGRRAGAAAAAGSRVPGRHGAAQRWQRLAGARLSSSSSSSSLSSSSSPPSPAAAQTALFDNAALASARASAADVLGALHDAADACDGPFTSWVTGTQYTRDDARAAASAAAAAAAAASPGSAAADAEALAEMKIFFDCYGFLHVPGFASAAECAGMLGAMQDIIGAGWFPGDAGAAATAAAAAAGVRAEEEEEGVGAEEKLVQFTTGEGQAEAQGADLYFIESGDKIHFFAEPDAVDPATGRLREGLSKHDALNKVGHGLHCEQPAGSATGRAAAPFKAYSEGPRVGQLAKVLGWEAPVLPQSMYIFKNPGVGGEVVSHQDSSFLHTEPRQTCLGMWLALHDARLDNGCLWVRPGSHLEPLRRVFRRNQVGPDPRRDVCMVFDVLDAHGVAAVAPWDGALPESALHPPFAGLHEAGFVPVEVAAGDLVCFPGTLDHLSLPNHSPLPRHTFQLHLVDGPAAGVAWSAGNWLQYPPGKPFPPLNF